MNEAELDALVEARLAAELSKRERAERERMRLEVISEIRRAAEADHHAKINRRHPIEDRYGGLGPEGHAARLKAMDERRRAANAHLDEVNSRPVPGGLVDQRSRALAPGSEGFEIRPGRR
jgi:hypothetical protein